MDAGLLSRFDVLQLAIDSGHDEKALKMALKRYLADAGSLLTKLETALGNNNILGWHHAAKTLREASLAITARKLASLCSEAQAINLLPHVQARAVLYHTQKELALLKVEISNLL
jgi:HPt (histidine-containing phosphotransfer) domain-containing protein